MPRFGKFLGSGSILHKKEISVNFQHPVRLDAKTQAVFKPSKAITLNSAGPSGSYFLNFTPAVFLHAYTLLGSNPQRFGQDLTLYLATTNTFFDKSSAPLDVHLSLVGVNTSDAKKRLSEDLGVALSSLFMVEAFGVAWDTIAQIPQNSKLSKKRPDFEGFAAHDVRHLFEAKGTTVLGSVEAAMHKAIEQVKKYPEASSSKVAIVSYLCADDRFFPSQTFVVDPPALPDNIPPTKRVAQLLHGEKVFQFAGLPETASAYIKVLSKSLNAEAAGNGPATALSKTKVVVDTLSKELGQGGFRERMIGEKWFVGKLIEGAVDRPSVFVGAERRNLDALALLAPVDSSESFFEQEHDLFQSVFPDGTCLVIDRL
jgi:hypothetical protein